jgi:purine-cytosine permease-like protein
MMEYAILAIAVVLLVGYVLYRRNYNKNNPRSRPANPGGYTNTVDPEQYKKELDKLSGK